MSEIMYGYASEEPVSTRRQSWAYRLGNLQTLFRMEANKMSPLFNAIIDALLTADFEGYLKPSHVATPQAHALVACGLAENATINGLIWERLTEAGWRRRAELDAHPGPPNQIAQTVEVLCFPRP